MCCVISRIIIQIQYWPITNDILKRYITSKYVFHLNACFKNYQLDKLSPKPFVYKHSTVLVVRRSFPLHSGWGKSGISRHLIFCDFAKIPYSPIVLACGKGMHWQTHSRQWRDGCGGRDGLQGRKRVHARKSTQAGIRSAKFWRK